MTPHWVLGLILFTSPVENFSHDRVPSKLIENIPWPITSWWVIFHYTCSPLRTFSWSVWARNMWTCNSNPQVCFHPLGPNSPQVISYLLCYYSLMPKGCYYSTRVNCNWRLRNSLFPLLPPPWGRGGCPSPCLF